MHSLFVWRLLALALPIRSLTSITPANRLHEPSLQ